MKKIAMVHTGAGVVAPLTHIAQKMYPEHRIMNLLDDTLIGDCIKQGGMTKEIKARLVNIFQYAYRAGADCVLLTCSSVGEAAYAGSALMPIPILRIDSPMAKAAVESARRIGVIATLATTLEPTCALVEMWSNRLNKEVEIVKGLAAGAYEAIIAGDSQAHDALIAETATRLMQRCDIFILAQASMARMEDQLRAMTHKKVYSSPASGIEQLRDYLTE